MMKSARTLEKAVGNVAGRLVQRHGVEGVDMLGGHPPVHLNLDGPVAECRGQGAADLGERFGGTRCAAAGSDDRP